MREGPVGRGERSPAIVVRDLVKTYGRTCVPAIDRLSVEVHTGELFAVVGPNGAGKTTLISMLTGSLRPSSGWMRVCGADPVRDPEAVRNRIGVIFQTPSLDPELTGEENVRLHAVLYGLAPYRARFSWMPRTYRDQVQELGELLKVGDALSIPVKKLSSGTRRKLELIRGLMHRPDVLFLDEPTAGLDPEARRSLWAYLDWIRREWSTTLFVTTHYLAEVEEASRVCLLRGGRIVAAAPPAELGAAFVRTTLVLDAGDRDALERELVGLGLSFRRGARFEVDIRGDGAAAIVQGLRVRLTHMSTKTGGLEHAYRGLIADA